MNCYLCECLELDIERVDREFEHVRTLMEDMGMEKESEEMENEIKKAFAKQNPFGSEYYVPFSVTNEMITAIYEMAKNKILANQPNAHIDYKVTYSDIHFNIDDETYSKCIKEREMREYE